MSKTICKNCSAEVLANMKFCSTCGTPVEQPVPEEATPDVVKPVEKQPLGLDKFKKFIKPLIAIIAVIILVSLVWNIFKPSKYEAYKGVVDLFQSDDQVVIKQNGKAKIVVDGILYNQQTCLDGIKTAFLVQEEEGSNSNDGYTLYLFDQSLKRVADSVFSFQLSSNGDAVAFTTEVDKGIGELCLYSKGKISTIHSEFNASNDFVISPDGSTVAYSNIDEDDKLIGYYYDGKEKELGKDIIPIAVSNGAKYVYYSKNDKLYVQKGDKSDTKESLGDEFEIYAFNKDYSQAIYTSSSGNEIRTYLTRNGGEKERLSGNINELLLPSFSSAQYIDNSFGSYFAFYRTIGVASFADTYYTDGSSIYHIDKKFSTTRVTGNASDAHLAADGKTILFKRSDSIQKVDGSKEDAEPVKIVEKEVGTFIATEDSKAVYYLNTDDELYYQKGKGKPVTVSNDMSSDDYYDYYFSLFKGNQLYYVSDDELYVSNGGKGTAVKGIDGDILYVYANKYAVIVNTQDGDDSFTYWSEDGKKFELVGSE